MQPQPGQCGRLLSLKDVVRETSLHRATIYRKVASGTFPSPRPLGGRRVAWREADVESWKADPVGWCGDG
ncbi:helix-turn-helix transcriptional regulator [Blastomonas sp.]|uniref:helix-turn-helix transcriptional regulator n=1 Tax=Blastomonas sp. TaxID=1909299 RepID=UPI00391990B9